MLTVSNRYVSWIMFLYASESLEIYYPILGKYSNILGANSSSVCNDCALGYYGDTNGLAACKLCEGGKYSDVISSSSCYLCPIGRYNCNLYILKEVHFT